MRKSFNFVIILVVYACLHTACNTNDPEKRQVNPKTCIDVMIKYFPYDINEHFVFVNDQTGEQKVCDAFNYNHGEEYPEIGGDINDVDSTKSYGDWNANITARMLAEDNPSALMYTPGYIRFDVTGSTFNSLCSIMLASELRFCRDEYFTGWSGQRIDTAQFFSFFLDTIIIPLDQRVFLQKEESGYKYAYEPLPKGACVHIVKNVGITDFSTDGVSFWRRIK